MSSWFIVNSSNLKKISTSLLFILTTYYLLLTTFPSPAFAQNPSAQPVAQISTEYDFGWVDSLGKFTSTKLMPLAFSIAAIMVVFYFIIGALELITSQGDKAHIVSARAKIYHAIIGLVLLIALFFILQYLIPALGIETKKPDGSDGFKIF